MRIDNARDFGLYLRDRRRELGLTQAATAAAAGVSPRWLSSVEAGKPSAETGLVLKTLQALRLVVRIEPAPDVPPGGVDLGEILRKLGDPP